MVAEDFLFTPECNDVTTKRMVGLKSCKALSWNKGGHRSFQLLKVLLLLSQFLIDLTEKRIVLHLGPNFHSIFKQSDTLIDLCSGSSIGLGN